VKQYHDGHNFAERQTAPGKLRPAGICRQQTASTVTLKYGTEVTGIITKNPGYSIAILRNPSRFLYNELVIYPIIPHTGRGFFFLSNSRYSMRPKRILTQDAWYKVRAAINNHEHLFRRRQVSAVFYRVLGEARGRFTFEMRGFRLVEERLSFYIRQADGLQLPAIIQWLKQAFVVQFNLGTERTGHVWGDRYWSRVLEGEPPEWAGEVDWEAVDVATEAGESSFGRSPADGVSPLTTGNPAETGFSPQTPTRSSPPPG
jgi:hypothetical protein